VALGATLGSSRNLCPEAFGVHGSYHDSRMQCGLVDGGGFLDCAIQDVSVGTHAATATYNKGN
jgi:hypothetical protein